MKQVLHRKYYCDKDSKNHTISAKNLEPEDSELLEYVQKELFFGSLKVRGIATTILLVVYIYGVIQ